MVFDARGTLIVQPHPASNCDAESYAYPSEIEVMGQVTRVALSLETGLAAGIVLNEFQQNFHLHLKLPALRWAGGIRSLLKYGAPRAR